MLSGTQKAYFHFIQQEARTSNDAVPPGNTRAPRSFQRSLLVIHAITTLNSGTVAQHQRLNPRCGTSPRSLQLRQTGIKLLSPVDHGTWQTRGKRSSTVYRKIFSVETPKFNGLIHRLNPSTLLIRLLRLL
jgi:hypothetical protein